MATIIEFRGSEARDAPRQLESKEGEIIIFPGVRRERHADEVEMAKPRKRERARPKRDRIELPE